MGEFVAGLIGLLIGVSSMAVLAASRDDPREYAKYAWMLGAPCWMVVNGDFEKFRVVAVSHKGAVAIRGWDDESGKRAKWVPAKYVKAGCVVFGDCPELGITVS